MIYIELIYEKIRSKIYIQEKYLEIYKKNTLRYLLK